MRWRCVEIIYQDYLNGKEMITGSRGSYVYVNRLGNQTNVVDALMQLPNTDYADKIFTL